jgi:hypothetical protein
VTQDAQGPEVGVVELDTEVSGLDGEVPGSGGIAGLQGAQEPRDQQVAEAAQRGAESSTRPSARASHPPA